MLRRILPAVCVVLFIFGLVPLWAHDLYLLPNFFYTNKGSTLKVAFHNGDSFPSSEVAPNPAKLQEARLTGLGGSADVHDLQTMGTETVGTVTVPAAGSLLLSVRSVPNFIELPADQFQKYLQEEGLTEVLRWREAHGEQGKSGRERYSKFSKSILQSERSDEFYRHALNFTIEIIPLADPYSVKAGAALPVEVLFRGEPAADLQLEVAWAGPHESKITPVGRTTADGRIEVPVSKAGLYRLHALKMVRGADPSVADWESYWASLTFEVR